MSLQKQEMRPQITATMLGNAAQVRELKDGDKTVIPLGVIMGLADGLSFRANPQDPNTPSIALTGTFEGIPVDPERATIVSTRCFLPKNVHDVIVKQLQGDQKAPVSKAPPKGKSFELQGTGKVPILCEIGVQKSDGGVGYQFVTSILREPDDKVDPLRELRTQLPQLSGMKLPALEAPAKAAPAKSKKKK